MLKQGTSFDKGKQIFMWNLLTGDLLNIACFQTINILAYIETLSI